MWSSSFGREEGRLKHVHMICFRIFGSWLVLLVPQLQTVLEYLFICLLLVSFLLFFVCFLPNFCTSCFNSPRLLYRTFLKAQFFLKRHFPGPTVSCWCDFVRLWDSKALLAELFEYQCGNWSSGRCCKAEYSEHS